MLLVPTLLGAVPTYTDFSSGDAAIRAGMAAYNTAKARGITQSRYLIVVDFTKSIHEKRLYVIDMQNGRVVLSTYCAHGTNSGREYVRSVSNVPQSLQSSKGTFITSGTYTGHNGTSIKIRGLERGVNDNALSRKVVIHGASYSVNGRGGHSWGCFAVPPQDMNQIIRLCGSGTILYAYYPH